ncbi:MAG: fatty acid desaturase family protein [Pseudomonadota bacterium]
MVTLQRPKDFFSDAQIAQLRHVSDWRGLGALLHCWGVILATWVVVYLWTNPLTVTLGVFTIGARQLGLGVLSHDGAHFTLFANRKLNDWVSEWILSRPFTSGTIYGYRKYHLQHHAHTQQEEDPDLHLSKPFPISKRSFYRKAWRDLSGQTGWKQYGAMFRDAFKGETRMQAFQNGWRRFGANIVINLVFLAAFTLAGKWYLYFLLWWLPALTWNRFIVRLRNIGEHAAVPDDNDRLRNTRTIEANWLERAFIAPYGVNYHLEHHLIVNAPFYRLPQAHKILLGKGLRERMEVRTSYLDMLRVAVPEFARN